MLTAHTRQVGYASLCKSTPIKNSAGSKALLGFVHSHEMRLDVVLCRRFRERRHKQGVSGLQTLAWNRLSTSASESNTKLWFFCNLFWAETHRILPHAFHLRCVMPQKNNSDGEIEEGKHRVKPQQVVSGAKDKLLNHSQDTTRSCSVQFSPRERHHVAVTQPECVQESDCTVVYHEPTLTQ